MDVYTQLNSLKSKGKYWLKFNEIKYTVDRNGRQTSLAFRGFFYRKVKPIHRKIIENRYFEKQHQNTIGGLKQLLVLDLSYYFLIDFEAFQLQDLL